MHISNADEPSIRAILKCNTLKSLYLIPSDLGREATVNLFSTLIDNTSLETLDISYSKCLDDGDTEALPGVIEAALSKNNTLKVLKLNRCTLSCPAVEAIATALAKKSNLDLLSMEQWKVSVCGVWQLFIGLATGKHHSDKTPLKRVNYPRQDYSW